MKTILNCYEECNIIIIFGLYSRLTLLFSETAGKSFILSFSLLSADFFANTLIYRKYGRKGGERLNNVGCQICNNSDQP